MAQTKRIAVTVPRGLLEEVDSFGARNGLNRSEVVRRAIRLLVAEGARSQMMQLMAAGYAQMGEINLATARECAAADEEAYSVYQRWLENG
ncbi:MAG: ribbon-helix-helix protein, CopG family [Bacillota bacterium]|nr:ribbon-helix-helix protein, CopG family [Bacillota bacterium]